LGYVPGLTPSAALVACTTHEQVDVDVELATGFLYPRKFSRRFNGLVGGRFLIGVSTAIGTISRRT
jgi:hypothetical protein